MRCAAVLALVVVAVAVVTAEESRADGADGNRPIKQEELAGLPDHRDPKQKKLLDCAACQSAAYEAMLSLENLRQATPKEGYKNYMISSSLDDLCEATKMHVGLLRDHKTKELVMQYGNERHKPVVEKYGVLKGAWVTPLWTRQCIELMERIEDDVLDIYNGKMRDRPDYVVCPMCPPMTAEQQKEHEARRAADAKAAADATAAAAGDGKAEL
jgi:hypothetical protein